MIAGWKVLVVSDTGDAFSLGEMDTDGLWRFGICSTLPDGWRIVAVENETRPRPEPASS